MKKLLILILALTSCLAAAGGKYFKTAPVLSQTCTTTGVTLTFTGGAGTNSIIESSDPSMSSPTTIYTGLATSGTQAVALVRWAMPMYFKYVSTTNGTSNECAGINNGGKAANPWAQQNGFEAFAFWSAEAWTNNSSYLNLGHAQALIASSRSLSGAQSVATDAIANIPGITVGMYNTNFESNTASVPVSATFAQFFYFPLTAASNASPSVLNWAYWESSNNLLNGAQVVINGALGNTAINGPAYLKTASYLSGGGALYSDTGLSTPIAANGTYTSGGAMFISSTYGPSNGYEVAPDSTAWRAVDNTFMSALTGQSTLTALMDDDGWSDYNTLGLVCGSSYGSMASGLTNGQAYMRLILENSCKLHTQFPNGLYFLNCIQTRANTTSSSGNVQTYFGLYPGDFVDYQMQEGAVAESGSLFTAAEATVVGNINQFDIDASSQRGCFAGLSYPGSRADAITEAAMYWLGDAAFACNFGSGESSTSNYYSNFAELMNLRHGQPTTANTGSAQIGSTGVWWRGYQSGCLAMVNTSASSQTVTMPSGFSGVSLMDLRNQTTVNLTSVTLSAYSGYLYMPPLSGTASTTAGTSTGVTINLAYAGGSQTGDVITFSQAADSGGSPGTFSSISSGSSTSHAITGLTTGVKIWLEGAVTDSNGNTVTSAPISYTPASTATFSVVPTSILNNGTRTLTLTGIGTLWSTNSATFTASGAGCSVASQSIGSNLAATVTITATSSTGTVTLSDGLGETVTFNVVSSLIRAREVRVREARSRAAATRAHEARVTVH